MPDLEEVLDALWVITVALSADSLHLFDLTRLASSLNVFEVDFWVLAEVYDGSQKVKQSYRKNVDVEICRNPNIRTIRTKSVGFQSLPSKLLKDSKSSVSD